MNMQMVAKIESISNMTPQEVEHENMLLDHKTLIENLSEEQRKLAMRYGAVMDQERDKIPCTSEGVPIATARVTLTPGRVQKDSVIESPEPKQKRRNLSSEQTELFHDQAHKIVKWANWFFDPDIGQDRAVEYLAKITSESTDQVKRIMSSGRQWPYSVWARKEGLTRWIASEIRSGSEFGNDLAEVCFEGKHGGLVCGGHNSTTKTNYLPRCKGSTLIKRKAFAVACEVGLQDFGCSKPKPRNI
jgi:hypothetical protein